MSDDAAGKSYKKVLYTGIFLILLWLIAFGVLVIFKDHPAIHGYVGEYSKSNIKILLTVIAVLAAIFLLLYFYLNYKLKQSEKEAKSSTLSFQDGHEMSLRNVNQLHEADERDTGKQNLKKPLFLVLGDTTPAINIGNDLGSRLKDYPFSWNTVGQGIFVGLRSEAEAPEDESQQSVWQEYLKWLVKSRARRPLSGIVLILEVNSLANSAADASVEQITSFLNDNRVKDLPVYIVIRNVDSLVGFSDVFSGSTINGTDVLGLTFSNIDTARANKQEVIDIFFTQLNNFLLQNFKPSQEKAGLGQYLFTQQLVGIKQRLLTIVDTVSSRQLGLRGIYFTEGFQFNENGNFLADKLSAIYQYQDVKPHAPIRPNKKKKYTIKNALSQIVLSESGMAGDNVDFLKARRSKFFFAYAFTGLLIAGTTSYWYFLYQKNAFELKAFNDKATSELSQYIKTGQNSALPESYVETLNFLGPRPEANSLLQFAAFGLNKNEPLAADKSKHYTGIVKGSFASAIAKEQINRADKYSRAASIEGQKEAFNALLIVKLLSKPNIEDKEQSQAFMLQTGELLSSLLKKYWQEKFLTESDGAQLTDQLVTHLQHGLAVGGFNLDPVDNTRVKKVQKRLANTTMPQRLYGLLKDQAESQYATPFDLSLELGEGFDQVFRIRPGSAYEFNRLFTREGFMEQYLVREAKIAELAAVDAWVLGERSTPVAYEGEELEILQSNMRNLYLHDYKLKWQAAIHSIKFLPATNLGETAAQLKVLSGSGLYQSLLNTINTNTAFLVPAAEAKPKDAKIEGAEPKAGDEKDSKAKDKAIKYVSLGLQKQFADYNKLLPKKIADIDKALAALSAYMSDLDEQSAAVKYYALAKVVQKFSAKGEADPMNNLFTLARSLPEPLKTQLQQVSFNSWRILLDLAVNDLNVAWGDEVYQYYIDNLQGRYPLTKTQREASLASIQAFYSKAGVLDVFYQTYLKSLLENKGKLNGLNVEGIQRIYKHADYIREGLFGADGKLKVEFRIEPTALSQSYLSAALSIDGAVVKYNHGVPLTSHIVWPNLKAKAQEASVELTPLDHSAVAEHLIMKGEWGLFRLLDQTQTQSLGDRSREISFSAGAGVANYMITTPSSINPLTKDLFSGFNLPPHLVAK